MTVGATADDILRAMKNRGGQRQGGAPQGQDTPQPEAPSERRAQGAQAQPPGGSRASQARATEAQGGEGGATAEDILAAHESQRVDTLEGFARGSNTAIANILGLPFEWNREATNWALESMGMEPIEGPVLGSRRFWKDGLRNWGILTDQDVSKEEMPPSARIGFNVGETLFATLPFAAAPFAYTGAAVRGGAQAARAGMPAGSRTSALAGSGMTTQTTGRATGMRVLGKKLTPARTTAPRTLAQTVASRPGAVAATEGGSAAGAAQGAGYAEAMFPGREDIRFGAELIGSVVNPIGMFARGAGSLSGGLRRMIRSFSNEGREQNAAQMMRAVVNEAGGDVNTLIRKLEAQDEFNLPQTAGQKTGSSAMLAMEKALMRKDTKAAAEFTNRRQNNLDYSLTELRKFADELTAKSNGDPDLLRAAARTRAKYFEEVTDRRIKQAEKDASSYLAKLGNASADRRASLNQKAYNVMETALKDMRKIESSLYDKIPRKVKADGTGLREAFTQLQQRVLKSREAPFAEDIKPLIKKADKGNLTAGDLLALRKELGAEMRSAYAGGDRARGEAIGELYDGVREDIDALNIRESDEATAFSKMLNDKFTRTFAGRVQETTREGAGRVPPEAFLSRAFSGGGEEAEVAFRQVEEAARVAEREVAERGEAAGVEEITDKFFHGSVRNSEEAFLREAAAQTSTGGRVNPEALARFQQENDRLLARFPQLARDLADAETAERTFARIEKQKPEQKKRVYQMLGLSRLLDVEDPVSSVSRLLGDDYPQRDYRNMARMAAKENPEALAGLKVATIDAAKRKATREGSLNFRRFREELFEPRGERGPALIDMMKKNGVINDGEADRLKRITDRAVEIMDAAQNPSVTGEVEEFDEPLSDLLVRITGANIGSTFGASSGADLVAAQRGSALLRRMTEKIPNQRTFDVLIAAAEDPKFAASLLKKSTTPRQRLEQYQRVHAGLLQAGLVPKSGEDNKPPIFGPLKNAAEDVEGAETETEGEPPVAPMPAAR